MMKTTTGEVIEKAEQLAIAASALWERGRKDDGRG